MWVDIDNDGDLDIFVVNHRQSPSLFQNKGNGTFRDIRSTSGITAEGDRHGAAWGDYDNDGDLDLFITLGAAQGQKLGLKTDQLYRNEGGGTFLDVASLAGVANTSGRGSSANWVDFDNDGYLDLFVKNAQTPNVPYSNNHDGTSYVTNGSDQPILAQREDRDCLVHGPHLLYRNNTNGSSWLQIKLIGTISNRDAIGAKLALKAGGLTQYRQVNGGGGGHFFSQGIDLLHFGLHQAIVIDSLTIQWPSGIEQTLTNILPNQRLTIVEEESSSP